MLFENWETVWKPFKVSSLKYNVEYNENTTVSEWKWNLWSVQVSFRLTEVLSISFILKRSDASTDALLPVLTLGWSYSQPNHQPTKFALFNLFGGLLLCAFMSLQLIVQWCISTNPSSLLLNRILQKTSPICLCMSLKERVVICVQ